MKKFLFTAVIMLVSVILNAALPPVISIRLPQKKFFIGNP